MKRTNGQLHLVELLARPFQRFVKLLAGGGVLLMIATIVAVIWANCPFAKFYEMIWHQTFEFGFEESGIELKESLLHWINDGLMAVFFFVVGLEIKRELMAGELSSFKQASLPIFAAIGGMLVPIVIFSMFGIQGEGASGWGIPMATDIAFSMAILALLGKRVPLPLKVFLIALAIVDDLGAVLVIAFFYSSTIHWTYLFIAFGLLAILLIANIKNVQNLWLYTVTGAVIWWLFLHSGVHATIAGVLVALTIPSRPKVRVSEFIPMIKKSLESFSEVNNDEKAGDQDSIVLEPHQLAAIDNVEELARKVQSPLQSIEHSLSGFINYFVLPLFALANAGVHLAATKSDTGVEEPLFSVLSIAIGVSLILGKVIGITLFAWIAVRLKFAIKPRYSSWASFIGLGFLGGVGFTMSLFIATLAYGEGLSILNQAKMGILVGSIVAGVAGYFLLKYSLKKDEQRKLIAEGV